jgi:hypothetical protein
LKIKDKFIVFLLIDFSTFQYEIESTLFIQDNVGVTHKAKLLTTDKSGLIKVSYPVVSTEDKNLQKRMQQLFRN